MSNCVISVPFFSDQKSGILRLTKPVVVDLKRFVTIVAECCEQSPNEQHFSIIVSNAF
jgi:hypothetical protein